jgi:hypothetical protein
MRIAAAPACRMHVALLTLLGLLLAIPESSVAGTAAVNPGDPGDIYTEPGPPFTTYEASPGERNRLSIVLGGGRYTIADMGAPVQAGEGCTQVSPQEVSCPAAGDQHIQVDGGDEDDAITVEATGASAFVVGGAGDDTLRLLGDATGSVYGETGDDVIRGDGAPAEVSGEDDRLFGGSGSDRISGGTGSDHLQGDGAQPHGNDVLRGGGDSDRILGDGGDDQLSGGGGADYQVGGVGNDVVAGGPGQDDLKGGRPRTTEAAVGPDEDLLTGGAGPDLLAGGVGGDRLTGGAGVDAADYEGADLFGEGSGTGLTIRLDGEPNDGVNGEGDLVEPDVERAIWRADSTFATARTGGWLLRERFSAGGPRSVGAEVILLSGTEPMTSAIFSGGRFVLRSRSTRNVAAHVALAGEQLRGCRSGSARASRSTAARRLARYLRTLVRRRAGSSRARASSLQTPPQRSFRVKGRFSSATAPGEAEWTTTDTCRGTVTAVRDGAVVVEDGRGRKRKRVGAGERYVAGPRR